MTEITEVDNEKKEINRLKKELVKKEEYLEKAKVRYEKIKDNPMAIWDSSAEAVVLLPLRINELRWKIWQRESIYEIRHSEKK